MTPEEEKAEGMLAMKREVEGSFPPGPVSPEDYTFTCNETLPDGKVCDRKFKSGAALSMHKVRKHRGRGWSTGGNFAGKGSKAELRKKYKKQYDLKKKQEREGGYGFARKVKAPIMRGHINYCPNCGYHLTPHELSVAITEATINAKDPSNSG